MPGALSDYLEQKLLDHTLAGVPFASPASKFISLHTAAPAESGTPANEVAGGSYQRQVATFNQATNSAGTYTASNAGNIAFTGMPAVTVTHVSIYDAPAGGNLLYSGALASGVVVAAGGTFVINAGSLAVSLD